MEQLPRMTWNGEKRIRAYGTVLRIKINAPLCHTAGAVGYRRTTRGGKAAQGALGAGALGGHAAKVPKVTVSHLCVTEKHLYVSVKFTL